MLLRTKLFIWFGAVFIAFFLGTIVLENYLVRKNLRKAERGLYEEIYSLEGVRRKHLNEYLGIAIADMQAEIDALLYRVDRYPYYKNAFLPDDDKMVWTAAADTLFRNRWIDFIQCSFSHKTYGIIPSKISLEESKEYPIDEDLSWIVSEKKLYMGVRLSAKMLPQLARLTTIDHLQQDPRILLMYNPEKLMNLSSDSSSLKTVHQDYFYQKILKAKSYVEEHRDAIRDKKLLGKVFKNSKTTYEPIDFSEKYMGSHLIAHEFERKFEALLEKDRNFILVFIFSAMLSNGDWDTSMHEPEGVFSRFSFEKYGKSVFSHQSFFQKPFFNAEEYYHQKSHNMPIAPSIGVVIGPDLKRLFLANTLHFTSKGHKDNFLTVGVKIGNLLQELSLSASQTSLLVHRNRVISAYDSDGQKISISPFDHIPLDSMQKETMGLVQIQGGKYFYLHLQPYSHTDLHFYTLQKKKDAFALIDKLHEETKILIKNISTKMRFSAFGALVIALLFLHNFSRKISKPIVLLSQASAKVKEGQFENLNLPKVEKGQTKEVMLLLSSFDEMVKGLRERERVRGVLNKVISEEIASEILQGQIHLGGKELNVAILFADIRNFTGITEKMPPQEIIEILNTCMTKITKIIDETGGVIDKYVGDEAMALFGAPIEYKDASLRAVVSAVRFQRTLGEWNQERKGKNLPLIEMGVGIHVGGVLAGNMGAENRLNYTVLGSNVNLASRICSSAAPNEVIITEGILNAYRVKDFIEVEALQPKSFKGFTEAVKIFRVTKLKTEDISFET